METIALRLDPEQLSNPDLDIRYELPALLAERSGGVIADDGYDYSGHAHHLVLFLKVSDVQAGLRCVLDVVQTVPLLGNDLRPATVVAIERETGYEVVYPSSFHGPFLPR